MSDFPPKLQIFFSDEFKYRLRALAKRYRNIQGDLQPLMKNLSIGNLVGDQIPGTGRVIAWHLV